MSAMTAKDARCLGCLLIERAALEAKLVRMNVRMDEIDAQLRRPEPLNSHLFILACGHRKELRDRRTGILCQLRAVRIEIEKLQGDPDLSASADLSACRPVGRSDIQVGTADEAA